MSETSTKILVSRENLPQIMEKAYELSQPQGLGFLHFREGGFPKDHMEAFLKDTDEATSPYGKVVGMDYVSGRAVKLSISWSEADGYYLEDRGRWYDHSAHQWETLKAYAESLN